MAGLQKHQPIILKLSPDIKGLNQEANTLLAFQGFGTVKLLKQQVDALLMEQAIPGISLKNYFPKNDIEAIKITSNIIRKLHLAPLPTQDSFPHIRDWLIAINNTKAKNIKEQLLASADTDVLLHGDLHHDNILSTNQNSNWLVIDPKGVIGEQAYEIATFIRNPIPQLLDSPNVIDIINNRIELFSTELSLDSTRIRKWCYVQSVLAEIWAVEDGINPGYFRQLTEIFERMI